MADHAQDMLDAANVLALKGTTGRRLAQVLVDLAVIQRDPHARFEESYAIAAGALLNAAHDLARQVTRG